MRGRGLVWPDSVERGSGRALAFDAGRVSARGAQAAVDGDHPRGGLADEDLLPGNLRFPPLPVEHLVAARGDEQAPGLEVGAFGIIASQTRKAVERENRQVDWRLRRENPDRKPLRGRAKRERRAATA